MTIDTTTKCKRKYAVFSTIPVCMFHVLITDIKSNKNCNLPITRVMQNVTISYCKCEYKALETLEYDMQRNVDHRKNADKTFC